MTFVIFALIWVITFLPAWYLLAKLVAIASSRKSLLSFHFISTFIIYQLIIAAPYLFLLLSGDQHVHGFLKNTIIGLMAISVLIAVARFFFSSNITSLLWHVYGYVYDGLLNFYPYRNLHELVMSHTSPNMSMRVLDLGAGTGNQSIMLSKFKCQIDAVDSSKTMLLKLAKKISKKNITNINVIKSDVLEYLRSAKPEKYDRIVMVNVLYAVEDRAELWKELLRVLKPSGKVVVTNSDRGGSTTLIKDHVTHDRFLTLLRPSLLAVFIVDSLISELAKSGTFSFVSKKQIIREVNSAGGVFNYISRCYGGSNGVNILFTVEKA
jgi:ubiquinone/menaquinone biosynthesis C-methylase UbiE